MHKNDQHNGCFSVPQVTVEFHFILASNGGFACSMSGSDSNSSKSDASIEANALLRFFLMCITYRYVVYLYDPCTYYRDRRCHTYMRTFIHTYGLVSANHSDRNNNVHDTTSYCGVLHTVPHTHICIYIFLQTILSSQSHLDWFFFLGTFHRFVHHPFVRSFVLRKTTTHHDNPPAVAWQ